MRSYRQNLTSLAVLAALSLLATGAQATTYYVANGGNDSNDGSSTTPFKTIQHAIDWAADGDTIQVATGTYAESIRWKGVNPSTTAKSLTLRGAGAGSSIIDPQATGGPGGRCMELQKVPNTARIEGFTFTHGNVPDSGGGGMAIDDSSPTVTNCAFIGNSAAFGGGMDNVYSTPTVTNCTFSGNYADFGGGMDNVELSNSTIINCTFSGNTSLHGGGMYNDDSPTIINCIVWGNSGSGMLNTIYSNVTIRSTDSQDSNATPDAPDSDGNFAVDPLFVRNPSPSTGDYGDLRLRSGSRCLDRGDNDYITAPSFPTNLSGVLLDLDGNPRIVNGDTDNTATVDMGAYEFQPILVQPVAQTQVVIDQVTTQVDGGAVLPATGQPLYAKLDAAIAALQAGDTATAKTKLQDFIHQVNLFVKKGRLTSDQGSTLTEAANAILALL